MRSVSASTKRSWMPSVTIRREDAVQRWPVEKKAPLTAHSTAILRSASSSTTSGFLPPISSWNLRILLDARLGDAPAGPDRAGEGDGVDVGMVEHRLADDRAVAHHEVEHALRRAGALEDVDDRVRAARHEIGRLEDDGVAVGERRRDLPGRNGDREIPRRDDADDADRLARDLDADARAHAGHLLAGEPQRLAGEEIEDLPGARRPRRSPSGSVLPSSRASSRPSSSLRARISLRRVSRMSCRSCGASATRPGTRPCAAAIAVSRLRRVRLGILADDVVGVGGIDVRASRRRRRPTRRRSNSCGLRSWRPRHVAADEPEGGRSRAARFAQDCASGAARRRSSGGHSCA